MSYNKLGQLFFWGNFIVSVVTAASVREGDLESVLESMLFTTEMINHLM